MSTLSTSDVEIANRGADEFLRVYYATYDSAQRAEVTGPEGIKSLLEQIPLSKHEVQSYDCHPIPSTSPPALLITVSGLVSHGPGTSATGGSESMAVNPASSSSTAASTSKSSRNVDAQPRVFSQSFVLMKSAEDKYYVASDHFRFVG